MLHNHAENIVDKLTKLGKIVISLAYFTADFAHFSCTAVKIRVLVGRLVTCHQCQVFHGIS